MRKLLSAIFLVLTASPALFPQETQTLYLSGRGNSDGVEWDFRCSAGRRSGEWTKIAVPSNWECQGFGQYSYGHMPLGQRVNESGDYRYEFIVPAGWKGRRVSIVFGASMTDTDVRINGRPAGPKHQGGYYEFRYDVSRLLKYGKTNLLEAHVDKLSSNESIVNAESRADFWVFGGIFRPVWLEARPASCIEHISIDAKDGGHISVQAELLGDLKGCRLVAQVRDMDGRAVGNAFEVPASETVNMTSEIPGVSSWNAETPNLYNLELSLVRGGAKLHGETVRFGFRTIEVRPLDGIYVNGVKVKFKGVNRHSFWPGSGRTLDDSINLGDALLIKEMNMNAVRCSHYPPERMFLDICDSLGLYVIDELTGWQDAYDIGAGRPLVREMIRRDVNHPSVIFWANGNEGGFNFGLLDEYAKADIQKRTVIHPWLEGEVISNFHYPSYDTMREYLSKSDRIWFPTEFDHGLYDGGHGAGLEDFWNIMQADPLCAGGFLWDLVDQGLVRTDRDGAPDTDGNHGADGILGPYREKEGSFYAIKEIWSPVRISTGRHILPPAFDGKFTVENRYSFTRLSECRFEAELRKMDFLSGKQESRRLDVVSPDADPGMNGILRVDVPSDFVSWDVLSVSVYGPDGKHICSRTWNISRAAGYAGRIIDADSAPSAPLPVSGFRLVGISSGDGRLDVGVLPSGWTKVEFAYLKRGYYDNVGVTFDVPEDDVLGARWLGNGPYRVWKNRLAGAGFGLWELEANDTLTGEGWNYPEFRGYRSNMYACDVKMKSGTLRIVFGSDNLFMHLLTPSKQQFRNNDNTLGVFPDGSISVLSAISPVGTKFKKPAQTGPQGTRNYVEYDRKKHTDHASGVFYLKFISDETTHN